MALSFLYGLISLPLWGYVAITLALVQLMLLGVTLYLHRDQFHGGLILHPVLRHFFRFWLWFSSGTVTREWVAVHRRHHAFADRPGDPHSPCSLPASSTGWDIRWDIAVSRYPTRRRTSSRGAC